MARRPAGQTGKTPGVSNQPSTPPPARKNATSWFSIAAGMILLVVLLVFILQNLQQVKVSFFTVHWRAPLAVDLLFATVLGGLIVFAAGSVRIVQLRRLVRHHQARAAAAEGARHPDNPEPDQRRD